MKKDIGVGVVGIHGIGKTVAPINKDGSSRLVVRCLCDLNEDLLAKQSEQWDVPYTTTDYDELVKRDDIDIVAIYTPDKLHCEQVLKALHAGKHVVVTKPMVNTMDEVEQVVAAVRETGKKLLVGETFHFDLPNVAARRLVDSGKLGDVIYVQASYIHDMRPVIAERPWRLDPTNKMWMVGSICHPFDYVMWLGGDVDEVSAYANDGGTLEGRKGHNNYVINLKFKNGVIGHVLGLFGVIHPPAGTAPFAVYCTKGSIVGQRYTIDTPGAPHGVQQFDVEGVLEDDQTDLGHTNSVRRYMKHMADCILNDKTPCCDVIVGAKTAAVSWAALESIETGKSVKVRNEFL